MTDKNHMIISVDAEKAFYRIQHPFMIKIFSKEGVERISLSIVKAVYNRSVANILSDEKLRESFFL